MPDEHDASLSELYRRSSREEPPAWIDHAVMDTAREAASRRLWLPFGRHAAAIAALAGVAIVSVLLVSIRHDGTEMKRALPLDLPALTARQPAGQPPGKLAHREPAALADRVAAPRFDFYSEADQAAPAAAPGEAAGAGPDAPARQPAEDAGQPALAARKTHAVEEAAGSAAPAQRMTRPVPAAGAAAGEARPALASVASAPAGEAAAPVVAARSTAAVNTPVFYLQYGSFRQLAGAEQTRMRLQAMAVTADISSVTLADGVTYHRVRSGPYAVREAAEAAHAALAERQIDSTVVTGTTK